MADYGSSSSRPSSSASSELPSLEDLLRESAIASQVKHQQPPDDGDRSSNGNTKESSSSVIIIGESNIANNSSSNSNNSSRRSSIMAGQSISIVDDMDMDTNVNTSSNDNDNADIHDDTPIPPLTSISAAVFVPIRDSNKLLQPLDLAPDSPAYHRAALDLVTRHESSVRSNLNALFHREMFRVRAAIADSDNPPFDYNAARAAHVRARDEDALRRDCDAMIANMRAPDTSNCKYGATNIPAPNMNVPVTYAPVGSPREFAATEVMKVIAAAVGDLASFDRHVRNRRATIKKQIQEAEAEA
ncbi:hypothetical protein M441DRAFT_107439, partial [Trichoderma asperellum CBS 433.97]